MYIGNYFNDPRLHLCPVEKKLLKKIYKVLMNMKCSYEKSVCYLLDYGAYSRRPIMSILKKINSMTKLYVYYGELDWCDPKTSFDSLENSGLDISKEYIPNTGHVFMIENPFWI
jgi:hypothetical protein